MTDETGFPGRAGGGVFFGLTAAGVATAGGTTIGVILGLAPAWHGASLAGPAFTASGVAGDNLVLHRALAEAPPGSVLVVSLDGDTPTGHWGELMCIAAAAARISGLVVSGTVRDTRQIEARQFPVFHAGVGPRPATKSYEGELGSPVCIGGVSVSSGDLIVADADGIAVVPQRLIDVVVAGVVELERFEAELASLLEQGRTTMDVLGLT